MSEPLQHTITPTCVSPQNASMAVSTAFSSATTGPPGITTKLKCAVRVPSLMTNVKACPFWMADLTASAQVHEPCSAYDGLWINPCVYLHARDLQRRYMHGIKQCPPPLHLKHQQVSHTALPQKTISHHCSCHHSICNAEPLDNTTSSPACQPRLPQNPCPLTKRLSIVCKISFPISLIAFLDILVCVMPGSR